jgi:hypothetical protein
MNGSTRIERKATPTTPASAMKSPTPKALLGVPAPPLEGRESRKSEGCGLGNTNAYIVSKEAVIMVFS